MTEDNKINLSAEQPISLVLTRDELTVLVRHWANEAINEQYSIFSGLCFSSSDFDRIAYAWKRVSEIADVLGDEATRTAVDETYRQVAQDCNRNHWIVFRYGTQKERAAIENEGGQCFEEFDEGIAERLASQVVERVFREGPAEQQMSLLKEELKRYSTRLHRLKSGPRYTIEIFGIDFPAEMKRLVLSLGIEDPDPNPEHNTFFKTLTLEQGKAILAALDKTARKNEGALKELIAEL